MEISELLLGILGGSTAVVAVFWLWAGKLIEHLLSKTLKQQEAAWKTATDAQLEKLKADLARGTSVATARVEHLRSLWEATHQYGGAVSMLAERKGDPEVANSLIDNFYKAISRAGVFIGHECYEQLLQRIGGPFLNRLFEARDDDNERQRLFDEFQRNVWPSVLGEIESMLSAPPNEG